jgi:hypothetical protein
MKWNGEICVGDHVKGVGMVDVGEEIVWVGMVKSWYTSME